MSTPATLFETERTSAARPGVWRRFAARRTNRAALAVVALFALVALLADFLASDRPVVLRRDGRLHLLPNVIERPELRGLDNRALRADPRPGDFVVFPLLERGPLSLGALNGPLPRGPDAEHPLGTDNAGRDLLARLVHGTRVSLLVGVLAAVLCVLLGGTLGLVAGWFGGAVDAVVSRATETLLNFPVLFLLLLVQGASGRSTLLGTVLVLGLTRWPEASRLVRAEVLRVRALPFVEAARALGAGDARIVARHVVPHVLAPLLVAATFAAGSAMLLESALSFLGFGVPDPTPSWGLLMTDAFQSLREPQARLLVLLPGLCLFATVTAVNLAGEGLRDAMDPRSGQTGEKLSPPRPPS